MLAATLCQVSPLYTCLRGGRIGVAAKAVVLLSAILSSYPQRASIRMLYALYVSLAQLTPLFPTFGW